jgi:hypothetical protein
MKALSIISIVLLYITCRTNKFSDSNYVNNDQHEYIVDSCDTNIIEGIFYFENYINSYISLDALIVDPSFIYGETITRDNYLNGLYKFGSFVKLIQKDTSCFKFNYKSIIDLNNDLNLSNDSILTGQFRTTNIKVNCNDYYTKYYIKASVVKTKDQLRRIPIILNCKELKEYKERYGKLYEKAYVPIYLFTEIFAYKRLIE